MVVFDASFLILLLDEDATPSLDEHGAAMPKARERIECLIATLSKAREKIVIPTPALSELLVYADDALEPWLERIENTACFRVAPFEKKAAIEAALAIREAIDTGDKRGGSTDDSWQKCKFDRQIVAIAQAEGATAIYSNDRSVRNYADKAGIKAYRIADLPEPPEDRQSSLSFFDTIEKDRDERE